MTSLMDEKSPAETSVTVTGPITNKDIKVSVSHDGLPIDFILLLAEYRSGIVLYCSDNGLRSVYMEKLAQEGQVNPVRLDAVINGMGTGKEELLTGLTVANRYPGTTATGKRYAIHVLIAETKGDKAETLRTWAHEISHATDYARAILHGEFRKASGRQLDEMKAACAELLADTAWMMTNGRIHEETPMSTFPAILAEVQAKGE